MKNILLLNIIWFTYFSLAMEVPESFYNREDHFKIECENDLLNFEKLNNYLKNGLLPDTPIDINNNTILHKLAAGNLGRPYNFEMMNLVLHEGADSNKKNNSGQTALHSLVLRNSNAFGMIFLLLSRGASPTMTDNNTQTPLSLFIKKEKITSGELIGIQLMLSEMLPTDVFKLKLSDVKNNCVAKIFENYAKRYNQRMPKNNEKIGLPLSSPTIDQLEYYRAKFNIKLTTSLSTQIEKQKSVLNDTFLEPRSVICADKEVSKDLPSSKCCIIQ